MQPTFWRLATISTACILIGFSLSLLGFVTTNEDIDCTINRKISYSIRYVGFLAFDLAQARKFIRVYSGGSQFKTRLIYAAFIVRLLSYVYNAVYVAGAVAFVSNGAVGIGPCQTVFHPYMIYQEHAFSVFYEFVLIYILGLYASQQSAKDSFQFSDLLKKIMDFEMYCFAFYLLIEILFLFIYALSPKNLVSVFNIFYLQIPVVLFFATTLNILERKSESYDSAKNQSNSKGQTSSANKSKGQSTANTSVPSVFAAKEMIDVPSTFGKTDTQSKMLKSVSVKDYRDPQAKAVLKDKMLQILQPESLEQKEKYLDLILRNYQQQLEQYHKELKDIQAGMVITNIGVHPEFKNSIELLEIEYNDALVEAEVLKKYQLECSQKVYELERDLCVQEYRVSLTNKAEHEGLQEEMLEQLEARKRKLKEDRESFDLGNDGAIDSFKPATRKTTRNGGKIEDRKEKRRKPQIQATISLLLKDNEVIDDLNLIRRVCYG
ncbi:hypothetical protein HDV01_005043 [Terramyces sp. JEL0728]|nr:hypothetical protein HDV01_005043 [Terramyces sp. JEL0728]